MYKHNHPKIDGLILFRASCVGGHLEVAQWLYQILRIDPPDVMPYHNGIFEDSCSNGHLNIAKWLKHSFNLNDVSVNVPFINCCRSGDLNMVKWLYQNYNIDLEDTCHSQFYDYISIEHNHDHDHDMIVEPSRNTLELAFMFSCTNKHLDVAQWLYTSITKCHIRVIDCIGTIFRYCCINDYFCVVQWLHQKFIINDPKILRDSFCLACSRGHIEIAKWLYCTYNVKLTPKHQITTFGDTCINGHLQVAKWLQVLFQITRQQLIEHMPIFEQTCGTGQLEVLKWLYITFNITSSDVISTKSFELSCTKAHLNTTQWLYKNFDIVSQFTPEYECKIFKSACIYGRLETAQWLYNTLNISRHLTPKYEYKIFKSACKYRQLETSRWLYTVLNIENINDKINKIFISCIKFDQTCDEDRLLSIIQWIYNHFKSYLIVNTEDLEQTFRFGCPEMVKWLQQTFNMTPIHRWSSYEP
jgi:hypothetical protein